LICCGIWLRWRDSVMFWLTVFSAFFLLHSLAFKNSPARQLASMLGPEPRVVSGVGVVLDEPKATASASGKFPRYRFTLQAELISAGSWQVREPGAKVLMIWAGAPPSYGDRVSFTGDIQALPAARNPGQFDYTSQLQRGGIFSEIHLRFPTDGAALSHGNGNPLVAFAHRSRAWMQRVLTVDLAESPESSGLVQTMVLGLKEATPEETRELFQRTGTLHLFVVNGLHIGMFAAIASFLLKPFGVRRRALVLAIIPLLIFYAVVTGLSPGSVRATIMASVFFGAQFADRNPVSMNSLAAAAFAMLLWNTNELFLPGFQFSFGVVFMIIALAGRIHARLLPLGMPDRFLPRLLWSRTQSTNAALWNYASGLAAISFSASLGSVPFTATYFHLLAPSALIANLLVVPFALAILFEGVLSLLAGLATTFVSGLLNNVNWLLAHAVLGLVQVFARFPGGHLYVELPRNHAPCEITVFDLGAGGAVFLRCEGRNWLLDCGNNAAYENIVRPLLYSRGVNRLDGLALSHGDVAHIGAAAFAFEDFRPREIVDSPLRDRSANRRAFHATLAARGFGKSIVSRGDVLRLSDNVSARVLFPPAGIEARTADDKALVWQINAFGTRVLLMSDSGFSTERWLLEHEQDLRSDILVKGEHASDFSGTPDFLRAVAPRLLICSASDFPPSEQVNEQWARETSARGIALFREDKTGAVEIAIRPSGWQARAFVNHQVFTSRKQ
jgi:competence protein ComEC